MFIAMNRFKVALGSESAFEEVWTTRDTHLKDVPGFVEFHLLKTQSEAFRAAHRNAGSESRALYLGHPEFEGFEVLQTVK